MEGLRIVSTAELQRRLDRDSGLHLLNVQTGRLFTGELIPGSRCPWTESAHIPSQSRKMPRS